MRKEDRHYNEKNECTGKMYFDKIKVVELCEVDKCTTTTNKKRFTKQVLKRNRILTNSDISLKFLFVVKPIVLQSIAIVIACRITNFIVTAQ